MNTGWTGGGYGTGKRMNLAHTRAMVQAAIEGDLDNAEMITDDIFGLHIPLHIPGVPDEVLQPAKTWDDQEAYKEKANFLANEFKKNFKNSAMQQVILKQKADHSSNQKEKAEGMIPQLFSSLNVMTQDGTSPS